jgi:hypothetical protein
MLFIFHPQQPAEQNAQRASMGYYQDIGVGGVVAAEFLFKSPYPLSQLLQALPPVGGEVKMIRPPLGIALDYLIIGHTLELAESELGQGFTGHHPKTTPPGDDFGGLRRPL